MGDQLCAAIEPPPPGLVEQVLAVLAGSGLSLRDAAWAGYHLNNSVTEFASDEARMAGGAAATGATRAQLMAEARRQFLAPPHGVPHAGEDGPHLTEDDPDALFDFGLQIWLDGLDRRRRARGD